MKGHKAPRPRKMDVGVDEPRMDRDDRPARSNDNNPAVENAAEARKSGGRAKMKRVGMVEGMKAMGHAGRKPRKSGGQTGDGSTGAPNTETYRRKNGFADRALRAGCSARSASPGEGALTGTGPTRNASPGEGALTGTGPTRAQPQPTPRPRPAVALKSGPTPGEIEADRLMDKYNAPAERSASPGEKALLRDMRAHAEPEKREPMKAYHTASDMGLKSGGTARKARASGGRTGSNSAPLSSAHMGDRSPTASKEIG